MNKLRNQLIFVVLGTALSLGLYTFTYVQNRDAETSLSPERADVALYTDLGIAGQAVRTMSARPYRAAEPTGRNYNPQTQGGSQIQPAATVEQVQPTQIESAEGNYNPQGRNVNPQK